jgi:hypothetical protein
MTHIIWAILDRSAQCRRCKAWIAAGSRAWHGNCEACVKVIVG